MIDEVPLSCPRALFNLEKVGDSRAGLFSRFGMGSNEGFDFDTPGSRDTFCGGRVDEILRTLAQKCGWEVRTLIIQLT